MSQPTYEDWQFAADVPILSARQREWLVTLPDDVVVQIKHQNGHNGDLIVQVLQGELNHQQIIPWEGYLDQPDVKLGDTEQDVHDLPTTADEPADA